jgi:hypothetical protein
MTKIRRIFVRKLVNIQILTVFPASIRQILAHFSFAPLSRKGLNKKPHGKAWFFVAKVKIF